MTLPNYLSRSGRFEILKMLNLTKEVCLKLALLEVKKKGLGKTENHELSIVALF